MLRFAQHDSMETLMVREILLATANPAKAREMREILALADAERGSPVRWRMLSEFPDLPVPEETGETFLANAESKAHHYASLTGIWTIADDSGLEVDALGGEPGVRSARYAGEPCNDLANNALLVERLAGVPAERRAARFRCAVVLSDGRSVLACAEGAVEGRIIDRPLGSHGFGYDPHFWVESAGMTTAQMSPEEKHAISHRGQALRLLREKILPLIEHDPKSHAPA
jgi:XTP/dITP diphosphohydrolase